MASSSFPSMDEDAQIAVLILKRDKDFLLGEGYLVYCEGCCIGRIFYAGAGAPKDQPWFWGLSFHEWRGSRGPQYGNVADLEAAKAAFRAAWERRLSKSD
jgi:hypothetical protein